MNTCLPDAGAPNSLLAIIGVLLIAAGVTVLVRRTPRQQGRGRNVGHRRTAARYGGRSSSADGTTRSSCRRRHRMPTRQQSRQTTSRDTDHRVSGVRDDRTDTTTSHDTDHRVSGVRDDRTDNTTDHRAANHDLDGPAAHGTDRDATDRTSSRMPRWQRHQHAPCR